MLRGLTATACLLSACAAPAGERPRASAPVRDPELALSTIVLSPTPALEKARPRRVGRLGPPFALGAPARNVLARAAVSGDESNVASR